MGNKEIKIRKNTSEIIQITSSAASYFIIATILLKFIIEPADSNNQVFVYGMFIVLAEMIILYSKIALNNEKTTIGRAVIILIFIPFIIACYLLLENVYIVLVLFISFISQAFNKNPNYEKKTDSSFPMFFVISVVITTFTCTFIILITGLPDTAFNKILIVWGLIYYTGIFGSEIYNTFKTSNKDDQNFFKSNQNI